MIIKRIVKKLSDTKSYYKVRKQKDRIIYKFFSPLLKLNADFITSTGIITGVISITFLNSSHFLFLSFWGLTRLIDLIDGSFHRYNRKTWFKKINLDKYADITYDTLLTCAAIPFTGYPLALTSIAARFIHLKLESKGWANSFLTPHSGFTHGFFILRRFKEGVIIQTLYSLTTPIIRKVFLKKKS